MTTARFSLVSVNFQGNAGGTSPGKKYQVQFTDDFGSSAWQTLPGTVVANGTTGSFVDNSGGQGSRRFYRVLLAR